jgi:hypothetical protein
MGAPSPRPTGRHAVPTPAPFGPRGGRGVAAHAVRPPWVGNSVPAHGGDRWPSYAALPGTVFNDDIGSTLHRRSRV